MLQQAEKTQKVERNLAEGGRAGLRSQSEYDIQNRERRQDTQIGRHFRGQEDRQATEGTGECRIPISARQQGR